MAKAAHCNCVARWCTFVGAICEGDAKSDVLQQIVEMVVNCPYEASRGVVGKAPLKIPQIPGVLALYKEYTDLSSSTYSDPHHDGYARESQISDL